MRRLEGGVTIGHAQHAGLHVGHGAPFSHVPRTHGMHPETQHPRPGKHEACEAGCAGHNGLTGARPTCCETTLAPNNSPVHSRKPVMGRKGRGGLLQGPSGFQARAGAASRATRARARRRRMVGSCMGGGCGWRGRGKGEWDRMEGRGVGKEGRGAGEACTHLWRRQQEGIRARACVVRCTAGDAGAFRGTHSFTLPTAPRPHLGLQQLGQLCREGVRGAEVLANQTTGQRVAAAQGPRIQWPTGQRHRPDPANSAVLQPQGDEHGRQSSQGARTSAVARDQPLKELFAGANCSHRSDRAQRTRMNASGLARRRGPLPRRP